jgi:hypothetical protein
MNTISEKNKIIPESEVTRRSGINRKFYRIFSLTLTACIIAQIIILIILYFNLHIINTMAK